MFLLPKESHTAAIVLIKQVHIDLDLALKGIIAFRIIVFSINQSLHRNAKVRSVVSFQQLKFVSKAGPDLLNSSNSVPVARHFS